MKEHCPREHQQPLTASCLWRGQPASPPGNFSPFATLSGKMGTCYLFISGSGERENRFLGPVRACIAFQTSSFLEISVSRGSKPCRGESREEQVFRSEWGQGGSAFPLGPSQLSPYVPPAWIVDTYMVSVPSLQLSGNQEPINATLPPRWVNCLPQTELQCSH